MLSAVAESAQVALQSSTVTPRGEKKSETPRNPAEVRRRDTITISPEAVQMTHAAISATEKSQDDLREALQEGAKEKG